MLASMRRLRMSIFNARPRSLSGRSPESWCERDDLGTHTALGCATPDLSPNLPSLESVADHQTHAGAGESARRHAPHGATATVEIVPMPAARSSRQARRGSRRPPSGAIKPTRRRRRRGRGARRAEPLEPDAKPTAGNFGPPARYAVVRPPPSKVFCAPSSPGSTPARTACACSNRGRVPGSGWRNIWCRALEPCEPVSGRGLLAGLSKIEGASATASDRADLSVQMRSGLSCNRFGDAH